LSDKKGEAPPLGRWARVVLSLAALGQAAVFAIAWLLPATDDAGRPRTMGAHEGLGLPPCNFYRLTGVPCPSCGLTTSFCHFVRGDLVNSLKANSVGTLLATCCLAAIPWSVWCAARARWIGIRDLERATLIGVVTLFAFLLVNWVIRLGLSIFD
jgi:hypothetical protein